MTRILIVEDEEKVRRMYKTMLQNEGFEVLEVPDAVRASYLLNKEPVDIILLDIKMPQVYGSVFYDIMQISHTRVKVIVASVYPVDEQKKMIQGAADYYDKAQGLDLLLEKVRKAERGVKLRKSVLVVDDEPQIRKIYRYFLEEQGYRIIEARDGVSGLDMLRKNGDVALVILDLAMPQKSGFEVYRQMRNDFPGIKILIASVFSRDDQKSFIPGADEYFDKSEDASGLVRSIEKLVSQDSSG